MRPIIALALCLSLVGLSCPVSARDTNTDANVQVALVPFSSPDAWQRLMHSNAKVDFFHLANEFEAQMNAGTCGPTTAVIVLNAIRPRSDARRPVDRSAYPAQLWKQLPPGFNPVKGRYTQRALVGGELGKVKSEARFYGQKDKAGKRDPGLQLRQLHKLLQLEGLNSSLHVVSDDLPASTIKADLITNLQTADDYVIVNYARKALGQPGGGHISPLAAYDASTDSFLIMDVNPNKAPWVWVSSADLIRAMRTFDTNENRGYLLVREGSTKQE